MTKADNKKNNLIEDLINLQFKIAGYDSEINFNYILNEQMNIRKENWY